MEMNLMEIWQQMGIAARGVVFTLAAWAIAVIAITIDRLWALGKWKREAPSLAESASNSVRARRYETFVTETEESGHPLARVLRAGLRAYLEGLRTTPGEPMAVELARRELGRELEVVGLDCRRGMNLLASVASVSPFVGLFGTVLGIIAAFQGIAKTGSGGLAAVSAGIAEALIVTGIGLGVAIPAVLLFNALNGKIDRFHLGLQTAAGELVDHLERNQRLDGETRLAA